MTRTLHSPARDYTSVILVVVLAVGIWLGVSSSASLVFGVEYSVSSHVLRAVVTSALVVVLMLAATRYTRAAGSPSAGLRPDRNTLPAAGIGAIGYLVPFVITSALLLSLSAATITVNGTPLDLIGQVSAVLLLVLLYEAIPEELIFRGFIFATLQRNVPTWVTVIVQAALFCLFATLIGAVTTPERLMLLALFSLALGVVRASTGSVYAAVGFHAAFQTVTQPVLGAQWTALTLHDPERWYSDIAYGLAPLVLGPLLVIALVRRRRRASSGSTPLLRSPSGG